MTPANEVAAPEELQADVAAPMSVRRSLFWSYGAQMTAMAASFIGTVIVSRLLTPYEMGLYAIALATSGILGVLTTFGVQSYVVREHTLSPGVIRAAFTVNTLLNILVFLLLAGAGWVVGHVYGDNRVRMILQIMAVVPLISSIGFIPLALLTREGRFGTLAMVGLVRGLAVPAINITLVVTGHGVVSLAGGPVVAEILGSVILAVVRGRDLLLRPTLTGTRPIFRFGFHLLSIGGIAQIATRASDLILGRLLGTAALGIYSRANVLATTLFFGVYGQASAILFVKMSAEMRDTGRIRDTFIRSIQIITVLMWPMVTILAILARPAVHILFGPSYADAATPLAVLMLWQFIAIGFSMNWELFVLNHETQRQVRFEVARAVLGTMAFTAGSLFSITGAAFGRVADALLGYFLYRPHMDRLAGTAQGELDRTYIRNGAITAATALPPLGLMIGTGWDAQTPVWLIAVALLLSGAIWSTLLLRLRHPLGDEILIIARKIIRRAPA